MKIPSKFWAGYLETATLAEVFGFGRRHMLRLLKAWESDGLVKKMKGFYPEDYRMFDLWALKPKEYELAIERMKQNVKENQKAAS